MATVVAFHAHPDDEVILTGERSRGRRQPGSNPVCVLGGCLRHHTPYDEHKAWAHRTLAAA
jgi:hypothetical protein